jgi:hypothetical protein
MPRSSIRVSSVKKSVDEKRRDEEMEWYPFEEVASKATQYMRSVWASCLKSVELWAKEHWEVSERSNCG